MASSETDEQNEPNSYGPGEQTTLQQGEQHRLDGRGIAAEIWQHTDAARPSDEDDIIRTQDDFGH